jgi:hypothetical protein
VHGRSQRWYKGGVLIRFGFGFGFGSGLVEWGVRERESPLSETLGGGSGGGGGRGFSLGGLLVGLVR